MLYTRTQEQGKTRNVWGYPMSDTLYELRYYVPWLNLEKALPWRTALLGPDQVDKAITYHLKTKSPDQRVVCVDFENYDASVRPLNIMHAFEYIASNFQDIDDELSWMSRRFSTIEIMTPDGLIEGWHGVPSGSTFTNAVDSLVQLQASGVTGARCQIQGDDGVYLLYPSEHDEVASNFRRSGLTLNEDKTNVFETEEAIYLQRYYHPDYSTADGVLGGVYSLFRAFARLKYLERWTDLGDIGIPGKDYFSIRAVMILENCKHHPAFREAVKLAQSLDEYDLGFDKAHLPAYSRSEEARVRATNPGLDITEGIDSFETMKVLRGG